MPLPFLNFGTVEERLARIAFSLNRSPIIFPFVILGETETITFGAVRDFGGLCVDRSWLTQFAPDAQWIVRAAGFVDPGDASGITVALRYQDNATTQTTLGSSTFTGAGFVKQTLGPYDVFATGSVPSNEALPMILMRATKLTAGSASLSRWTLWLELRTSQQG